VANLPEDAWSFLSFLIGFSVYILLEALLPASVILSLLAILFVLGILLWTRFAKGQRGQALWVSFNSAFWFGILPLSFASTIRHDRNLLLCVLVLLLLHAGLVIFVDSWRKMATAYFILGWIACFLWPGGALLGGRTLKLLGIGGGIPVTIRVKVVAPNQSQTVAVDKSGCLLLALGGDVYFAPKRIAKKFDCPPEPSTPLYQQQWPTTCKQCVRYGRTDVLTISRGSY
jgi:hypothetical protein